MPTYGPALGLPGDIRTAAHRGVAALSFESLSLKT